MTVTQKWIAFHCLTMKESRRILRVWVQTLLPSPIMIILYLLIFGNVIGSKIGLIDGYHYMAFILPGLIIMPVMTNAYSNVVSSFFAVRFNHSIEEMLVSPMPNWLIIAGYVMGGVVRGVLNGIIVGIIGVLLVNIHIKFVFLSVLTLVLCSVLFSLAGFINGMLARTFDDLAIIPSFVLTPLIYLGGVFYDPRTLPPFWREISMLNPIHYIISLFRHTVLGLGHGSYAISLLVIVGFIVLLFGVCWWGMERGVKL